MPDGKTCPACQKDIGVWSVFSAGMPNRIRCPHCRTQLRYDGGVAFMIVPFAIVAIATLIVHEAAIDAGIPRPGLFAVVLLLVTWIPLELLLVLFLRERRTLRIVR